MLPCRTFVELFLRGDIDPDWQYILRGVVFGFRIINPDWNVTYSAKPKKINSEIFRNIIDKKLIKEIKDFYCRQQTVVYTWYILWPVPFPKCVEATVQQYEHCHKLAPILTRPLDVARTQNNSKQTCNTSQCGQIVWCIVL